MDLRIITAAETRPLRQRILRPHQRPEELVYPGEDLDDTRHFGAYVDGALVGVASIYRDPPQNSADRDAFRLRGMATAPEVRGLGYGAELLEACVQHARARGGRYVWCNARTTAAGFYRKLSFVQVGGEFELPQIGPHVVMRREL